MNRLVNSTILFARRFILGINARCMHKYQPSDADLCRNFRDFLRKHDRCNMKHRIHPGQGFFQMRFVRQFSAHDFKPGELGFYTFCIRAVSDKSPYLIESSGNAVEVYLQKFRKGSTGFFTGKTCDGKNFAHFFPAFASSSCT